MRISDWSSDVCSSDLGNSVCKASQRYPAFALWDRRQARKLGFPVGNLGGDTPPWANVCDCHPCAHRLGDYGTHNLSCRDMMGSRSEEHTSELQSLMRSSYAVFCLKNKNTNTDDR